jgi:RNA polymerase sigma-70 factor (ECF subfamily)
MGDERTTAAVQRYLDELAGDASPRPVVRDLLDRSVRGLQVLCGNLPCRPYRR